MGRGSAHHRARREEDLLLLTKLGEHRYVRAHVKAAVCLHPRLELPQHVRAPFHVGYRDARVPRRGHERRLDSRDHAVFVRDPERARKLASHSAIERLASAELCGNRRELTDGAAQMAHRRGESDARVLRNLDADIT